MPWQSPTTPQVGDHGSYYEHDATVVAVDLELSLVTIEVAAPDNTPDTDFITLRYDVC